MTVCMWEWEKWDFQDLKVITIFNRFLWNDFWNKVLHKYNIKWKYERKSIEMEKELVTIEIVQLMQLVIESQPTYIISHSCSIVK